MCCGSCKSAEIRGPDGFVVVSADLEMTAFTLSPYGPDNQRTGVDEAMDLDQFTSWLSGFAEKP